MAEGNHSWLMGQAEKAVRAGLTRAYDTIRVDPSEYLFHLRTAHELPVQSYEGLFSLPVSRLDQIAFETVRSGMKLAAAEGAGFGVGGFLTLLPDLGVLATITMRTMQKLSLIYGFQFNTDEEIAELWIAVASAAGVDLGRDLLERSVVKRFVPVVIGRIAISASKEMVEKWAARMVPLVSSGLGAVFNYYFVRAWGRRAIEHFRRRHLAARDGQMQPVILLPESSSPAEVDDEKRTPSSL